MADTLSTASRIPYAELSQEPPSILVLPEPNEWSDVNAYEHDFVVDLVGDSLEACNLCTTRRAQASPEVQDDRFAELQDLGELNGLASEHVIALISGDREIGCSG